MNAVFTSTRQALHVSFLLEVMPAVAKSQMQVLIQQLMEQAGITQELERHERQVDFSGLSALEVRGQCALVVGAVNTHLAAPEQAAVWTHYGMKKRQADGVRALADYVAPMLAIAHGQAHEAMIWGRWGRFDKLGAVQRDDFSIRKIASEFGLPHATVQRDQQRVVACQRQLENRALQRLEPYFDRTGLVGVVASEH
jgi:hypothetical protein